MTHPILFSFLYISLILWIISLIFRGLNLRSETKLLDLIWRVGSRIAVIKITTVVLICFLFATINEIIGTLSVYAFSLFLYPEIFLAPFNANSILKSGFELFALTIISSIGWATIISLPIIFYRRKKSVKEL